MKNIEGYMKLIIPDPIWRWEHFTNKYDKYPAGDGQWMMIKDKLILTAQDFIKEVFLYDKIKITSPAKEKSNSAGNEYPLGELKIENGYCKYTFKVIFGEFIYSFQVTNIPVSSDTKHIETFFSALLNYLSSAYLSLESNIEQHQRAYLLASYDLMRIADSFILNFPKTVMLEYLYYLLNYEKNMLGDNAWTYHDRNRYNMELIEKAYVFANELSSRKIENKEIYTGFIFHDSEDQLINNSIKRIKLNSPIDFGNFNQLKSLIPATNGKNIFFNVTQNKITHVFMTREEVLEISMAPNANGKNFTEQPLILSVQGSGKVLFIQGDIDRNRTIFQLISSKPIIKDLNFIEKYLATFLSTEISDSFNPNFFIKWLLSIPVKKKGTTVVIGDFDKVQLRRKLVHFVEISIDDSIISHNDKLNKVLLDHITNPDGALVFDKTGSLLFMSAILPFSQGKKVAGGGARHQSAINFTKKFKCIGITVSEDGSITIFNKGKIKIKF